MPTVTVRTMFDLARILGRQSVQLDVKPGSTVRTALEALIAEHGGLRGRLFDPETGGLLSYLFVELNGRDIRALQGLETSVQDGDGLSVLIPVAGGAQKGGCDARDRSERDASRGDRPADERSQRQRLPNTQGGASESGVLAGTPV